MPSERRPFATSPSSSPRIGLDRLSARAGLDVGEHDRNLEPAEEERRELRRHQPGADDADALDPPRLGVGQPAGRLMRRSTTSNA